MAREGREAIDAAEAAVRAQYAEVAEDATGRFPYPVGRASAERLGYSASMLDRVPASVVDRFVGVGNPFTICGPLEGRRVLDVGCGCGLDSFVAAALVGSGGRVVGIDVSAAMLAVATRALAASLLGPLEFRECSVREIPFGDATFDVVISNGVLNLVPDKDEAFAEIARVLRPGGVLAVADLLADEGLPEDVRADPHAWAT